MYQNYIFDIRFTYEQQKIFHLSIEQLWSFQIEVTNCRKSIFTIGKLESGKNKVNKEIWKRVTEQLETEAMTLVADAVAVYVKGRTVHSVLKVPMCLKFSLI